ncbi:MULTISPECIES: metal-sulfur cluster assembly factor [unclassified Rhizobacter]|uniref:metal-sulfur cluster assembly factor n=1 Tax=unclassified Rhizobacter TaxID=2640088 RepID=UPI0006FA5FFC|nr:MULTISPECIES: metal-sulfur cluster assembly factor [unclassified Rhizobacter]KQU67350.1 hydroxylase [Rhizobacter sp. Root29]KQW14673.1 hydroxylase [Rhizobacter sp. Root1238]KRB24016.1 hydroxylase [Rhizobacter sp. Root16D2]
MNAAPIDFDGPEALREPLLAALARVVDPELALSITDLGLVYRLQVDDAGAQVRMTMTSPACPVIDLIVEDVENELDRVLPAGCAIAVEVCWEPAWTPDRMSERARRFLQR